MDVLTLTPAQLADQTGRLARRVRESGFLPELVVGIRTGGEHVARLALEDFPEARLAIVRRQRESTRLKTGMSVGTVLKPMPYMVTDRLRIAEHRMRERRVRARGRGGRAARGGRDAVRVESGATLAAREYSERRILVVDDAVDTGQTMADVMDHLGRLFPRAEIRSFSISRTMEHPLVEPDYAATGYGTLVRFFWSEDYHAE
ncbi:phosphoribosyltransferase family protein [Pseudoroseicyclus sp. H15]